MEMGSQAVQTESLVMNARGFFVRVGILRLLRMTRWWGMIDESLQWACENRSRPYEPVP